jgi:hypothetical protein
MISSIIFLVSLFGLNLAIEGYFLDGCPFFEILRSAYLSREYKRQRSVLAISNYLIY